MSTHRIRATALFAAVVIGAAACGKTTSPETASPETTSPETTSAQAVTIDTFAFTPKVIRVRVGDTVTWTNKDDILHTVTSGSRDYDPTNGGKVTATRPDGMIDAELDGRGATTRFTFTKAGTFHYFCNIHPGMEADVEVS